jgi:hypothetical protein
MHTLNISCGMSHACKLRSWLVTCSSRSILLSFLPTGRAEERGGGRGERTAGNGNGVYDQKCRTGLIDDMEKQETKWIGVNETSMAAVNIKGKLKKTRARISERQEREVEEEEHS